jgi:membrane protein
MSLVTSFRILIRAGRQWIANQDSVLGAALAYYALFSIAPLLVISIRIASFFFEEEAARTEVIEQLSQLIGKEPAAFVQGLIDNATQPQTGFWATLVSIVVLVIGAVSAFLHVRSALCTIWKLEPPKGNTYLAILLDYGLALLMVLITGGLLLLSLAGAMVVPIFRDKLKEQLPNVGIPWQLVEFGFSLLLLTLLFTAMFLVLSDRRISWRYVIYGALVTSFLFTIGKFALGMYLVYSSTASVYGSAGSLVVFLLWVYYSSQILFFGAEMVQARRTRKEWLGA